jgi:ubiquinone/menaquinone biosynthesis C-methylase UbiE
MLTHGSKAKQLAGPTSPYDPAAPSFELHRPLPSGVAEAIRAAALASIDASRPRLLDLGAGTGRIGWPFVAAGDDYVGADLSLGMLREFARRTDARIGPAPPLVQADGRRLPFADATFDAVLLMQVLGAAQGWQQLVLEARRLLRAPGVLIIGQTALPAAGLDARMKRRLASLLEQSGVSSYHVNGRRRVQHLLDSIAHGGKRVVAAAWIAERTPRAFLDRQQTGAQFSKLPEPIREAALDQLGTWAAATFGSIDAMFSERHAFELRVFEFHDQVGS